MSSTAYYIFVMQAYLAGQEIEKAKPPSTVLIHEYLPTWNWEEWFYRIKLPEGYKYVYENGKIAFRIPKDGENYIDPINYIVRKATFDMEVKRPIIKRIDE